MPGEMPDKLEYRNIGQEKYEKNKSDTCRQMDCQTVVQYVSDQMPNRMSLRMSEYVANMSDRMPLFIYIYQIICQQAIAILCICSLMGITRSKNFESSSMVFFAVLIS